MADKLDGVFASVKAQLEEDRAKLQAEYAQKEEALRKQVADERQLMHSEWTWVTSASGRVQGSAEQSDGDACGADERVIELNVGGTRYKTTRDTLVKKPGSMLEAMFSGRHPLRPDKDGSYFIDNEGAHFGIILNYLRHDTVIMPDDPTMKAQLAADAKFYGLKDLEEQLVPTIKSGFENAVVLEAASMGTPINSGGWSRRFVWASKASELADVGDDGSIKIKADANVMLTLQAHLQVGYGQQQDVGANVPRVAIKLNDAVVGGTFLARSNAQGQQDSQSCVVQKLIALSEGDVITAEFRTATSAPHHHHHGNYMHNQAEQTELSQAFKTSLMLICC